MKQTITKRFDDLPFAHRQATHPGHCRLIHGHNWSFEFEFKANELDKNGFIVDFGSLKWLREWLEHNFDHTLVLSKQDPALEFLKTHLGEESFANIVVLPGASVESIARYVYQQVKEKIITQEKNRVHLVSVRVYEDGRNSTLYYE
jgi:6-pyruvoyltetrahydropterin/6-carboxytetrahydropterin synthase